MIAPSTHTAVNIDRIFLDLENPRHEPFKTQAEVIAYLCKNELILPIARDIAKNGLSPLELFAVLPGKTSGTFIAAEGNRRLCAIKLLNDPDLAPPNLRKDFGRAAAGWTPISQVNAVIFNDRGSAKVWLDRLHDGLAGGIGRKNWNADQKQRNSGQRKNSTALAILDYAQNSKMITAEERRGKLTTVQRYLGNKVVREALGLDLSDPAEIKFNRPKPDFDALVKRFVADLVDQSGEISSRKNKEDITEYARKLSRMKGLSGETIAPEPLAGATTVETDKPMKRSKPKKPSVPRRLPYDEKINDELKKLNSYKLSNLYFSICDIPLDTHTPLVAVGLWAFLESLCKKLGSQTDFPSFLSPQRLNSYGLGDKEKTKGLRQAIERVSKYGNTTKHDEEAANFASLQLANDMEKMRKMILKCAEDAVAQMNTGSSGRISA